VRYRWGGFLLGEEMPPKKKRNRKKEKSYFRGKACDTGECVVVTTRSPPPRIPEGEHAPNKRVGRRVAHTAR